MAGEGVERTFPFHSPIVLAVEVRRKGKVRRSKLFYLRDRIGKATRVKERRGDDPRLAKKEAAEQSPEEEVVDEPADEPADEPEVAESEESSASV